MKNTSGHLPIDEIKPYDANMASEEGMLMGEQYVDNVKAIHALIANFPTESHEAIMTELSNVWALVLTSTWNNLEITVGGLSDKLANASPGVYIAAVKFLCRHAYLANGQWE